MARNDIRYWSGNSERISRRKLIQGTGVASVGGIGALLVGCGSDDEADDVAAETPADGGAASPAATATTAPVAVKRGGTVTIAMQAEPNSLDPHLGKSGIDHSYFWSLSEGLVGYDDGFNPTPALATEWELNDPTTITFKLRAGVKFHDGTDFNSEAVKVNLERVLDKSIGSSAYAQMSVIDSVTTPDPLTVVLKLKTPSAPLILNLGDRGGMMLSAKQLREDAKDRIARAPIGTGPFTVQEWQSGSHVVMKANPGYWQKDESGNALPYVDGLRYNAVANATTRATSVETGDNLIGHGIEGAQFELISKNPNIVSQLFEGFGTQHIRINLDMVTDVRVRRAMMWAMNRDEISKAAFRGLSTPGVSPIGPRHEWAFYKEIQKEVFEDLNKSRQLLQEAGQATVKLKAEHQSYDPLAPQVIQAQLKRVGIELELDPQDALNKYHAGENPLFITPSFSIRADPDGTIFELYHGRGAYNAAAVRNGGFFSIDPNLDKILEKAQQVYELEERAQLYHEAERIIVMDAHGAFFGWRSTGWAHGKSVQGFTMAAEGKARFLRLSLSS
ncbi:MAG: ABC transporter substrate-binding protein [Dehalococcoidia bacterium]|nr:ABC transporter substrate-binding protein [Dehalococcoidia bacterium]